MVRELRARRASDRIQLGFSTGSCGFPTGFLTGAARIMQSVSGGSCRRTLQDSPMKTALVVRATLVPEGAHQSRNFASVTKELRIIAGLAVTTNGHIWSCCTHKGRRWLFTGELSLPQSRARGMPTTPMARRLGPVLPTTKMTGSAAAVISAIPGTHRKSAASSQELREFESPRRVRLIQAAPASRACPRRLVWARRAKCAQA